MSKKRVDPTKTDAWASAELLYADLHATQMTPFFGRPLSPEEIEERLEDIARTCPDYYPATLALGVHRLARGVGTPEDQRLPEAIRSMIQLSDPEDLDEQVDSLITNLENAWRFDAARSCLELLVEHQPENALYHDYLAHATAKLGDLETALRECSEAISMEPNNPFFLSNLGLYQLMAGNVVEAKTWLTKSLQIAPDNEVSQANFFIAEYLTKHGGNFTDYLLRPVDFDEMERLDDEGALEELGHLCTALNQDRLAAFAQSLVRDDKKCTRCAMMIGTLTDFFDFVDRIANLTSFLNESLAYVNQHFDAIMNKFIFKFGDVDRQLLEEIYESLAEFYGFLERSGLVPASEFKDFQNMLGKRRQGFLEKMERYNAIRHDESMEEEEKESIREELFGDDHRWPHI